MRLNTLWATLALVLATAPAVTAMAVEGDACAPEDTECREQAPTCAEAEPCLMNAGHGDEPTYGTCDGEVCAYGDPDCIACSGPVDLPTDGRGPADCENCRGEVYGDVSSRATVGFGLVVALGAMVAVLAWVRER